MVVAAFMHVGRGPTHLSFACREARCNDIYLLKNVL
jgi:hypothetical protein